MNLKDFINQYSGYGGSHLGTFSTTETFEKLRKRNFSSCTVVLKAHPSDGDPLSLNFSTKTQEHGVGVIRKKLILRQVRTKTKTKTALLRWVPENLGEFEGFTLRLRFKDRRSGSFDFFFAAERLKLWEHQL